MGGALKEELHEEQHHGRISLGKAFALHSFAFTHLSTQS